MKKKITENSKLIKKGFVPPRDPPPGFMEPRNKQQAEKAKFGALRKLLSDSERKEKVGIADKFKEPLRNQPEPFKKKKK